MSTPGRFVGTSWSGGPASGPRVLNAMEGARPHTGLVGPISYASSWVLDYNLAPGGLCRVGGETDPWFERDEPVGHLYPPGTRYWEDSRPVGSWLNSAYVRFEDGGSAGLETLVRGPRRFARLLDPEGLLAELLRSAAAAGHRFGPSGFWKAQSALMAVVHLLLQAEPVVDETWRVSSAARGSGVPELVLDVRDYLAANLAQRVTLADVARHSHVSVSTLSHRYRAEAGETPMETLTRMRVNAIKGLMIGGTALKNVAEVTGFCDVYHLSKVFKRAEGLPPKAWLRSQRAATSGGRQSSG